MFAMICLEILAKERLVRNEEMKRVFMLDFVASHAHLGGGFNIKKKYHLCLREDSHFDQYFSKGWKPTTN